MSEEMLDKVGKRLGDIMSLPKELRDQLNQSGPDPLEMSILKAMKVEYQGIANLDEILVALYRRDQTIHKRTFITSKMHRMAKDGYITSVPGKKGVYKLPNL
jgi:hypothetical protein